MNIELPDIYKCFQCGDTYGKVHVPFTVRAQLACKKCGCYYFHWLNVDDVLRKGKIDAVSN